VFFVAKKDFSEWTHTLILKIQQNVARTLVCKTKKRAKLIGPPSIWLKQQIKSAGTSAF